MSKRAISEKMKEKYKKKDENRAEAMVKELSDKRDRYKESKLCISGESGVPSVLQSKMDACK